MGLHRMEEETSQVTAELVELAKDISASLRGLIRVQEEWSDTTTEFLRELLLEVRNLDRTLRDLVDVTHLGTHAAVGADDRAVNDLGKRACLTKR